MVARFVDLATEFLFLRFVVYELAVALPLALIVAPRLAARHVRRQAADVTATYVLPVLEPRLQEITRAEIEFMRAETETRITAAQARLNEQHEAMIAEISRREQELAAKAAEREQELAAKAAEIERSAEMSRRGSLGNVAREANTMRAAEIESWAEAKWGADVVALLKDKFPSAWKNSTRYPELAERLLTPAIHAIMGGTAPGAQQRQNPVKGWS